MPGDVCNKKTLSHTYFFLNTWINDYFVPNVQVRYNHMIADKPKEMNPSMAGNSGSLCRCPGACRSVIELLLLKSLRFAGEIKELSEHNAREMQLGLRVSWAVLGPTWVTGKAKSGEKP